MRRVSGASPALTRGSTEAISDFTSAKLLPSERYCVFNSSISELRCSLRVIKTFRLFSSWLKRLSNKFLSSSKNAELVSSVPVSGLNFSNLLSARSLLRFTPKIFTRSLICFSCPLKSIKFNSNRMSPALTICPSTMWLFLMVPDSGVWTIWF